MSSVVLMLGSDGGLPSPKQPGFFTERSTIVEKSDSHTMSSNKEYTITISSTVGRLLPPLPLFFPDGVITPTTGPPPCCRRPNQRSLRKFILKLDLHHDKGKRKARKTVFILAEENDLSSDSDTSHKDSVELEINYKFHSAGKKRGGLAY
ncbi:hypothetical protein RJ640_029557 [Escallonia rubra]|uniref:Uncharacterized protein n=1 Tax=Escallonia rubra TaxID=112253 RepID=A0AA88RPW1_9ASTE|nr:hypothetical protein RJ640_029557 [Escallonia rubra]